nr:hypothetical protein [Tanacetum cinerariifolium]
MKHYSHNKFHRSMACKSFMAELGKSGLRHCQVRNAVNAMKSPNEPTITSKQCADILAEERKQYKGKEFYSLIKHFQEKAAIDVNQYFKIDLFDDGSPRNIFRADGRSRDAYLKFGDVVVFDVIYLTNKFKFSFSPIVGVNHHGQSIIFGGALLENEKEETFKWLFKQFLKCMFNKCPSAIITDQDKAISVDTRRAAEEDEDFKTMNSRPVLSSIHQIEAKAGEGYTKKIFQKEWIEATTNLTYVTKSKSKEKSTYWVGRVNVDKKYWRIVNFCFVDDLDVTCLCAMFETYGILYKDGNASIEIEETTFENRVSALALWYVQANLTKAIEQARDDPSEIKRLNSFLVEFLEDQMIRKKPTKIENAYKDAHGKGCWDDSVLVLKDNLVDEDCNVFEDASVGLSKDEIVNDKLVDEDCNVCEDDSAGLSKDNVVNEKSFRNNDELLLEDGDGLFDSEASCRYSKEDNENQLANVSIRDLYAVIKVHEERTVNLERLLKEKQLNDYAAENTNPNMIPNQSHDIPSCFSICSRTDIHYAEVGCDGMEIDKPDQMNDYNCSQPIPANVDALIQECAYVVDHPELDVLQHEAHVDRSGPKINQHPTTEPLTADEFQDDYMSVLNDEEMIPNVSLDDMKFQHEEENLPVKDTPLEHQLVDELIDAQKDTTNLLPENVKDEINKSKYMNVVKADYKPHLETVFAANIKSQKKKCGIQKNYVLRSIQEGKKRLAMALGSPYGQLGTTTTASSKTRSMTSIRDTIVAPEFEVLACLDLAKKGRLGDSIYGLILCGLFESPMQIGLCKGLSVEKYAIKYAFVNVVRQADDSGECGVWVCIFLYRLSRKQPLEFKDPIQTVLAYRETMLQYFWNHKFASPKSVLMDEGVKKLTIKVEENVVRVSSSSSSKPLDIDLNESMSLDQDMVCPNTTHKFIPQYRFNDKETGMSLIVIDGAHLKGTYQGTNLVAVRMDGNNQIIPIATGVSQGETGESWTWFLNSQDEELTPWESAKIRVKGLTNVNNLAKSWSLNSKIKAAYEGIIYPVKDIPTWQTPNDLQVVLLPVMGNKLPGRPKNRDRIRSQKEGPILTRCGRCGAMGCNVPLPSV